MEKRYVIHLASSTLFVLAFCLIFNAAIDPFGRLGFNRLGIFVSSEREAKAAMIHTVPHDTLLLGSSKVAYIDPNTISDHTVFNAAFPSALPEEIRDFLKFHAATEPTVIIGLDFYMFNERAHPMRPTIFKPSFPIMANAEYLLSLPVLKSSIKTVWDSAIRHEQPFISPAGNRNAAPMLARNDTMAKPDFAPVISTLLDTDYRDVAYSTARLEILRQIKALAEERGSRLIVFLNPQSTDLTRALAPHTRAMVERYRADMRAVFPDVRDFTDSRFSEANAFFRFDPYHYLPTVGTEMINEALSLPPPH